MFNFTPMKKETLMTVAEYAALKGVATNTVYVHMKSGKIKFKQIGKTKLVIV